MNYAFEIAGVGLSSQQRALDVIANNIANINTPGFKRSDMRFVELIASARDVANSPAQLGQAPTLAGVAARAVVMMDAQGEVERTGRPLDIAIQGDGLIEVMGPSGQTLLWRGGSLGVDADGLVTTADGLALSAMITIPSGARDVEFSADGVVRARLAGSDDLSELGQITLVRAEDPQALERLDGGFYRATDGVLTHEARPGEDGAGEIVQGGLERSNVEISDEMVRLMLVQRAYAANAQIVQAADQMMGIANGLRR
jgi:flagellar basal-body rod protein FlgG